VQNEWRKKMYNKWLCKLLKKALNDKIIAGLFMMNLAPEAQRHMGKVGLKTKSNQQLRSLIVEYFKKEYFIAIIDAENEYWYAGFFELIKIPSHIIQGTVHYKGKWIGYCKGGLINTVSIEGVDK